MIRDIRTTEAALGDGQKMAQPSELENRAIVRKSIAAARDLPAGTVLQAADLTMLRPGTGLAPALLPQTRRPPPAHRCRRRHVDRVGYAGVRRARPAR